MSYKNRMWGCISFCFVFAAVSSCIKKPGQPNVSKPPAEQPQSQVTPPAETTPKNITIEGAVYVAGSKSPVAGALVSTSLDDQTAKTDGQGHFLLKTNSRAGTKHSQNPYAIKISAEGYQTFDQMHAWGDNPANQTFNLAILDPYSHIKELAAPIVQREYKDYLSQEPSQVPTLIGGQPARETELQKAFNQENTALRASQSQENQKFGEEKQNSLDSMEKTLNGKNETEQAKIRREFSGKWEQARIAKQKRQEEENFYLRGRQILEKKQMKTMFAQERAKVESAEFDPGEIESAFQDYSRKHQVPAYLIALGQGKEMAWPSPKVVIQIQPPSVQKGKSAKLVWQAWNAEREVAIEPEIGKVTGHPVARLKPLVKTPPGQPEIKSLVSWGSTIEIAPQKTTQYKIVATGLDGKTAESIAEVRVQELAEPPAEPDVIIVPGTADPYLAGAPEWATASACEGDKDTLPRNAPALFKGFPIKPGMILNFSASGSVNNVPSPAVSGTPDGTGLANFNSGKKVENGIVEGKVPMNALVGVFLADARPASDSPPVHWEGDLSANTVRPQLDQIFFIGDGLTGTGNGEPQNITVPERATRLYLGTSDGCGWWNNWGSFKVKISAFKGKPISDPPPKDEARHEPVQNRNFIINSVCAHGKTSFVSNTSWDPPSIEVNQGDKVHLTVIGPSSLSPEQCYSVSFAIKEYDILLAKITRGTKQEVTFEATKNGAFTYADAERRLKQTGQVQTQDLRDETVPGTLTVHKNVP